MPFPCRITLNSLKEAKSIVIPALWLQPGTDDDAVRSYNAEEGLGSVVTVGSGVGLHTLYEPAKSQSKIFVGGTVASVVSAGGYIQGAGHSALGPLLGMAADYVLGETVVVISRGSSFVLTGRVEFQVVLADGSLVTANEVSNPDRVFLFVLYWDQLEIDTFCTVTTSYKIGDGIDVCASSG
jgi:hypothetical protein